MSYAWGSLSSGDYGWGVFINSPSTPQDIVKTFQSWIIDNNTLTSIGVPDRIMELMNNELISPGALPDRMMEWLSNEGYTGTLSERLTRWVRDNL